MIDTSAETATVVVVVAELFAGVVSVGDATLDVFVIVVPLAVELPTLTTRVNVCGPLPAASVVRALITIPVQPTVGVVFDQPAGEVSETNVVPAGIASVSFTVWASLGPALFTTIV